MRALRLAPAILGAACAALAVPVSACSVVPGYEVPTARELAAEADTIVLADVVGGTRGIDFDNAYVSVRPTTLLKGDVLPEAIKVDGWALSTKRLWWRASDPNELLQPNPGALMGGCVRYMHRKGSTLLLFLKQVGDSWQIIQYPFARTAEDVPANDAPWVRAVRIYAEASQLPGSEQDDFLREERGKLEAAGTPTDLLLAEDIGRNLVEQRREPFD